MADLLDQFDVALLIDAAFELDGLDPFRLRLHGFFDGFFDFHQSETMRNGNPLAKQTAEQLINRNFQRFANDVIKRRVDRCFAIGITFHRLVHQRVNRLEAARVLATKRRRENVVDDMHRRLRRLAEVFAVVAAPIF